MSSIWHLATEPELLAGIGATHYVPARLAEDGFVHCCGEPASALAVARDYFGGASAPVFLLELDPRRLGARLVFEAAAPLPGAPTAHVAAAEKFPHVYGPIALRAIASAARLEQGAGVFRWPERFEPLGESLGFELAARLSAGEARGLAALRRLRRSYSRALRKADALPVLELGAGLVASGAPGARVLGSELVFAGQAFRGGRISEAEILRWTRSRDRWWRRAALVSTVPLNVKAQGGHGDARRTLRICRALVGDRDDMVVKALSWALRALAERDPAAVRRFLEAHQHEVAARALREVRNKLRTGRKSG